MDPTNQEPELTPFLNLHLSLLCPNLPLRPPRLTPRHPHRPRPFLSPTQAMPRVAPPEGSWDSLDPLALTVIREYKGKQQKDANSEFSKEAQQFATLGYTVTSQSWAQGQWGCGAWLIALLCILLVGLGLLIIAYMVYRQARRDAHRYLHAQGLDPVGVASWTAFKAASVSLGSVTDL